MNRIYIFTPRFRERVATERVWSTSYASVEKWIADSGLMEPVGIDKWSLPIHPKGDSTCTTPDPDVLQSLGLRMEDEL